MAAAAARARQSGVETASRGTALLLLGIMMLESCSSLSESMFETGNSQSLVGEDESLFPYEHGLSSQSRRLLGNARYGNKYAQYESVCNWTKGHTGLPDAFVKVQNNRFTINGKKFYFAGWNIWEILEAASNAPAPFRYLGRDGRGMICTLFNQAVEAGLSVVRMWGHTITPGFAFQTSPGKYREDIFQSFDFILDEARKRGLKVVVVFADNWYPVNGVMNYVKWKKGQSGKKEEFFTDGGVMAAYKENIKAIMTRKNTFNGRVYRNDPTIMAWNLANECRCTGCPTWKMQNWIDQIAGYVKSMDRNHLVGVGHEGFYGPGPDSKKNPNGHNSDWASKEGQDFLANHKGRDVDYVGIHVWPDNWALKTTAFLKQFIRDHVEDSKSLGKPFVLEEFGKIVNDKDGMAMRDRYYRAAYEVAEEYAKNEGILQGTLFWHWYDEDVGPGRYGLHYKDSTFNIVKQHSKKMKALNKAIALG